MLDQQIYPVEVPDLGRTMSDLYGQYCRQLIVKLLEAVRLNVVYTRAKGDWVWWQQEDGQSVKVLDMAGGYGATLFGHNHPGLVAELKRLLDQEVPVLTQASCRAGAAILAQRLSQLVGDDYVTIFTNSGTETVEAAIKHTYLAYREQQRLESPVFWAVKGAFHGKTIGALQLTPHYREPFDQWGPRVRFLDPDDPGDWEKVWEETAGRVVAAFVEPIQGEGGIRPLPQEFLKWLSETCRTENIPLVADEIQTGMGRTGTFLASEQMGLKPDYICLSKALGGGGLVKIGALLIKRPLFVPKFALIHTSTFAEDDLSCLVALKALEILEEEQLPTRCAKAGRYLLKKLEEVRALFPGQIREIRGKGLMIGIEFMNQSNSPSNILKMVSDRDMLGWLAASYLLNVHHIRIAPTLSDPFTLRIQPSAYISTEDLDRLVNAIRSLAQALAWADAAHLIGPLVGVTPPVEQKHYAIPMREKPKRKEQVKVAFVGHYLNPENVGTFDPYINTIPADKLQDLITMTGPVLPPTIFDQRNVRSITGEEIHLNFIGISITAQQIHQLMQNRDFKGIRKQVDEAVALANDAGCSVVGIGAYLPSVTNNCREIHCPQGIALTSGNSLTVGMGIEATKAAARSLGMELSEAHVAVVGVPGNIASTLAILIAPLVKELTVLFRRNLSSPKALAGLVKQIRAENPEISLRLNTNLTALRACSVIVTASTSGGGIILPEHLRKGKLVIVDISRPYDVSPEVAQERPDVLIIPGGDVRLPCNDDFSISGISLPPSHSLACMAETMLMGLEGSTEHGSIGSISPDDVRNAMEMAQRHGFTLGTLDTKRR